MATAAATAPAADAEGGDAAPKKGKKKLIIIIAAVLLVVLAGGGAAVYMMKQKAAAAEAAAAEGEDGEEAAPAKDEHAKKDKHKGPPVFVPLDPFVVNLADRDTERYAQIGITLQVDDPHFADELKLYLPAVRNGILMVLAHKTSKELLERRGKEKLAAEIMREAVRPMGIEVAAEEEADTPEHDASADPDTEEAPKPKKKKKKKAAGVPNPVTSVNFSSFIIQ
ncbi:MAG: flagellar basal body-associated FliL family protein [Burkholderiaceae bacterium]|nr:flagellar basal body-associated FliL family protein [Burkholderiaceae bacterium]